MRDENHVKMTKCVNSVIFTPSANHMSEIHAEWCKAFHFTDFHLQSLLFHWLVMCIDRNIELLHTDRCNPSLWYIPEIPKVFDWIERSAWVKRSFKNHYLGKKLKGNVIMHIWLKLTNSITQKEYSMRSELHVTNNIFWTLHSLVCIIILNKTLSLTRGREIVHITCATWR